VKTLEIEPHTVELAKVDLSTIDLKLPKTRRDKKPKVIKVELDLVLPLEKEIEIDDGRIFFGFEEEPFKVVLQIYEYYRVLGLSLIAWHDIEKKYILDLQKANERADNFEKKAKTCQEDRKYVYKRRDKDISAMKREQKKDAIKTGLIIGGTGLGALGLGFLIGFFAAQ